MTPENFLQILKN